MFDHHENKGGTLAVCCNCGELEHCGPSGVCDEPAKYVNCSADHPANSKQCPQWVKEKKILKIKCENFLSFSDARKQYKQFYTGQTYMSAVKSGTCNKSTQTDNKSTQTDYSFTEYIKQQATEITQEGTQGKSNSSPHPGKCNSSHPGPALKQATLNMTKKDEEKKKKEEKDKLKKLQKEERRQQYLKEQAQKEKEEAQKAKQAEKNPYFVFAEKDEEKVMVDDSVVFTEPYSSNHLPKVTLSRLPLS